MQAGKLGEDFPDSEIRRSKYPKIFRQDAWKVRPCEWFEEEWKDCKSYKARFHQLFVYGTRIDCTQWEKDCELCYEFRRSQEPIILDQLIESEEKRRTARLEAAKANDVWKYRDEPPADWNKPLPEWMAKKSENSLLASMQRKINANEEKRKQKLMLQATINQNND